MNHRFSFALLCGLLALSGPAISSPAAPAAASAPDYVEVAARFNTTSCSIPCEQSQSSDWYLWRSNNRVEIRAGSGEVGEIWRRDSKGRISFVYVEPAHKRGIEYNTTDLRIINHWRPWDKLASIVTPADLAKLTPGEATEVLGHPARRYSGQMDKRTVEVVWIPDLQLAAQVTHTYPDRQVTTKLKSLQTAQEGIAPTSENDLANFQLVDFTDLGDMETNESMAWLKQVTAAPGHEHHDH